VSITRELPAKAIAYAASTPATPAVVDVFYGCRSYAIRVASICDLRDVAGCFESIAASSYM
jgi:hypothetical protein